MRTQNIKLYAELKAINGKVASMIQSTPAYQVSENLVVSIF